ncbi:hypothetical protein ACQ4PT_040893 [Festuca glaucescens]
MGFISGTLMGLIAGVALIFGLAHAMNRRAAKRSTKASAPTRTAATMVIRDSVEPILDDYRPAGISSLKFSRLSLGTVPPKIEGIRVQSFKKGQITMDIDFKWGGDPNIILAVETLVASLPIQDTVASLITDMLQWPHRIVIPLGGVDVDISDLELKPQGKVTVTVVRAESLKNKELIGKSDPYVVLFIRPMFKEKTRVIDDNLNPEWNETFELIAEDKETQHIILEVFDEDSLKQDKRLGIAKLPLSDLGIGTVQEINLQLLSSLDTTKVLYHPYTKKEALEALELEKKTMEERRKTREGTGAVSGAADAAGGVASTVTNVAGTGVAAGAAVEGSGVAVAGSGVGLVGTGIGAFGNSITKAGKFVGRTVTGPFSSARRSASSVPTIDE